jgi:hypothetical protein
VVQAQPHHLGDDVLALELRLPRHHGLELQADQVVLVPSLRATSNIMNIFAI